MTTALILELPKNRSVIRTEVSHSGGRALKAWRGASGALTRLCPS